MTEEQLEQIQALKNELNDIDSKILRIARIGNCHIKKIIIQGNANSDFTNIDQIITIDDLESGLLIEVIKNYYTQTQRILAKKFEEITIKNF